ncbi:cytochrome c biogenesis protein CcmG/thiol:disulfide interchange protein DsbE [Polymorphobacter multimanifer]|uniref:Cytochrome c biogenesis protein CcmG/thiol:disulfide interchange protein DsbE n=1 Tax=Polymorphobacter multimanifer TaxID=1070431 RepID=A0A841L2T6_9SPHN|nr:DsbE family thiol:disulfide interchange protein [Polymorphobacter multimanifer]MBB6227139.1 cytochrome c biogenesis protein CcmG/thiol:disulfide interchange protein DsbE [Polymorphobacter multimanifer]
MKRLLFLLPILAFVGLFAVFGVGLTHDPKLLPSQLIDRPLPEFELPGIAEAPGGGPGFASASIRGEPALLNVFASWCAACPQEHPVLTRIAEEGVPVYGLAWKDVPADSRGWLEKWGNPYVKVAADEAGRTAIDLGVTGVPETFIVDKRGRVRYKQIGPISPEQWTDTLKPLLAQLRAEA